jgi:hypothetical protein
VDGRTDRQAGIMKLIGALRRSMKKPKNWRYVLFGSALNKDRDVDKLQTHSSRDAGKHLSVMAKLRDLALAGTSSLARLSQELAVYSVIKWTTSQF